MTILPEPKLSCNRGGLFRFLPEVDSGGRIVYKKKNSVKEGPPLSFVEIAMTDEGYKRKLSAIISADAVGYSRLMSEDEEHTVRTITAYREVLASIINGFVGRVVDSPGDNLLAEFESVVDAVKCALDIQREIKAQNETLPVEKRMQFRIGVNLGDVIHERGRIYGDGVNIAARLEGLARPGEVWISGTAYDQVKSRVSVGFEYQGRQHVKNIKDPIRIYRILPDPEWSGKTLYKRRKDDPRHRRKAVLVTLTAAVVLAVAGAFAAIKMYSRSRVAPAQRAVAEHRQGALSAGLPSIAVLPFVNMSQDPEQEYFADGFTEDLITDLSKIAGLRVISRNSVFLYKGKPVKISEIAREFDVGYVLEGSVRKVGPEIRINAQLIDVNTVGHIWADRYDRRFEAIFDLQDEVCQKIVSALALKLTSGEEARLFKKSTENLEAYDVYLRGMELYARFTQSSNEKARAFFTRATRLDPRFAEAYAKMGWTHFNEWSMGWSQDPQSLDRAHEAAETALSLDEDAAKALCLLGSVLLWEKKHNDAVAAFEKSLKLEPSYADALSGLGDVLAWSGRPEDGIPLIQEAIRLNPAHRVYYMFYLGHAYFLTHRYSQALEALRKSLNQNPDFFPSRIMLAAVYSEMDQIVFGRQEMAEVLKRVSLKSFEAMEQKLPYKDPLVLQRVKTALSKLEPKP